MRESKSFLEQCEEDKKWFEDNFDNLRKKYGKRYLAILRAEVLDYDRDRGRLLQRMFGNDCIGGFYLADLRNRPKPPQDIDSTIYEMAA